MRYLFLLTKQPPQRGIIKTTLAKVLLKSPLQRVEELANSLPPGKATANGRQITTARPRLRRFGVLELNVP
jgi:hypothetical protein